MSEEDMCDVCGGTEELKERQVAHDRKIVCSFCWENYSLAEIISEVDMK